jgi:hypothetical protein
MATSAASLTEERLARVRGHAGRRSGVLLFLALFAVYCAGLGLPSRAGSDLRPSEAHVLLTTQSLTEDGDFELSDDYRQRSWRDFYDGRLTPNALTVDGRLVEVQGLAFPALLAPAYAIGGRIAVELFLAAIMALGFVLAAALGRRLVPDPWATGAALAVGLSPPAVIAATTIAPAGLAATLIAGAALLALQVHDEPRTGRAAGCALLLAAIPWVSPPALGAGAVVAAALVRWLRRKRRTWTGIAAIELVLVSLIVWITVNRRLFGGFTPYSASTDASAPTGAHDSADYIERLPRALGVLIDPQIGVLLYAPLLALAGVTGYSLWRLHRERLAQAFPDEYAIEVAALLMGAICAAAALTAIVLAPSLDGRAPGEPLVVALPCAAALCAWSLRRHRALALTLALIGVALSVWMLAGARLGDDAALSPVSGPVPWSALGDGDALR